MRRRTAPIPLALMMLILPLILACCRAEPGLRQTLGAYEQTFPHTPAVVMAASEKALVELGWSATRLQEDGQPPRIMGQAGGQTRIYITALDGSNVSTRAFVRVEPGNSQTLSMQVLAAIQKHLPKPQPAEQPVK